jgi:predicted benzoate:H+ symporter BenE
MSARVVYREPADEATAWALAVRVAGITAVVCAAIGLALQRFMGVGPMPLLVLSAAVALVIGLRLPAAAPAFLRSVDPLDAELEDLLDDSR